MQHKKQEYIDMIVDYIDEYRDANGGSTPTGADIATGVGLAPSTVSKYMSFMREQGIIDYSGHRNIFTKQSRQDAFGFCRVPILGAVACGVPKYAEENIEEYVRLASLVISNPNPYYYTSSGLTLKSISVPGYRFLGWYDLPAGNNAEIVKSIPADSTGDITLYAHWEILEYNIQFNSELVKVDRESYSVNEGKVLPTPKLDGYKFIGWSDGEGALIKSIPVGTTGTKTYTANWLSDRNQAWAKKELGKPFIFEDEETDTILFYYEIGEIRNVPLDVVKDFGKINSDGVSQKITTEHAFSTDENLVEQYGKTVAKATVDSVQWSLSSGWSDSVSYNEQWREDNGLSESAVKTLCQTDNENWLISSGSSGSDTTVKYESSQDYDLSTATKNTKTYDVTDETNKFSAELDLSYEHKSNKLNPANVVLGENNFSAELDLGYDYTKATKSGTEGDEGSNDQTGSIKHTGTDKTHVSGWNTSNSKGGSKTVSNTDETSKTVSKVISNATGYGKDYTQTGDQNQTQGTESSSSAADSYSNVMTYSKITSDSVKVEYDTSNTKTGYHRVVYAGTAHVFAVVGYNIATSSYFVSTYSIMDDERHLFEDYSYDYASYDDNQNSVIPFEVPYEVEEYVLERVGETDGLEINEQGIITDYNGTESVVIIPEYRVVYNRGVPNAIKVTGIDAKAFAGKGITAIGLSDYITEIPAGAFKNCNKLVSVDMPGVTTIGANAFSGYPPL